MVLAYSINKKLAVRENIVFINLAVSIVTVPVASPVMNDDTEFMTF